MAKPENRIKIVLLEERRPMKWLAAEMDVTHTTVSRWCCNYMQPSLESLYKIADVLDIDVRRLLAPNKRKKP